MRPHTRPARRFTYAWVLVLVTTAACAAKMSAPPEPPVAVRRADEAFRYRDYDVAVKEYRHYLDDVEHGEYTPRVAYKSALASYRLGHYRDTLATLDDLSRRYPDANFIQVYALRGDAQRELEHPLAALREWDFAWENASDNDRQKLRQRIVAVARGLNNVDLARARREMIAPGTAAVIDEQIALRQPPALREAMPETDHTTPVAGGPVAPARGGKPHVQTSAPPSGARTQSGSSAAMAPAPTPANRERAESSPPPPSHAGTAPEARPLDAWAQAAGTTSSPPTAPSPVAEDAGGFGDVPVASEPLPPRPVAPEAARVACLLPLSGPDRPAGERALRAMRLVFAPDQDDRLLLKDTASDAAKAVRDLEEISRDPAVLLAIGPLRSEAAAAVAGRAGTLQLPVLLLSHQDGVDGPYVTQVGMANARLVAPLLAYSMEKIRLRRFGVIYPQDPDGKEMMEAFRREVERRGGTVVGTETSHRGAPALNAGTLKKWRKEQHLQAIFLPDDAPAAARLAHFLQDEMPDVTLLGAQAWEPLGDDSDPSLNGIVFADGFYASSSNVGTRAFVERYRQAYGEAPGLLEAQAYDAAVLAKRAFEAGAATRAEALRQVRSPGPVAGASSELAVTLTGVERRPILLQVYDGKLRELTPSTAG